MRPDFISWATSPAGMYLYDKQKPTLATWQPYQVDILRHLFPAGEGRLPYSQILWSEIKKAGKTELAAAVHLYFALFVDVPGEQYVLANDFMGAKSRTWQYIAGSLERNPYLKKDQDWSIVGSEIMLKNGSTIKAIPTDYRGEAGSNHSLATIDEPWGIMHKDGERLMTEFEPVPTREQSTTMYTGYQGFEGQSNFWHGKIDSVMAGEPVPELMHIDDGDGKPACWRNGRMFLLWSHVGRQPWHTEEFMEEKRRSFGNRQSEFLRVWENRRVKNADAFCTDEQWERLFDPALRGLYAGDKRPIVLGVDAATKNDCAAIVGCTWNDEKKRVDVVFIQIWMPEDGLPLKLTQTVGPGIVDLHEKYFVAACYYDPYQMAAISEMCTAKKVTMVEFPQTARRLQSDKHLHDLIVGGNLAHYGDPQLQEHVTNAMTKESERGMRIVKEISSKKVDAAVALSMAALGTVEVLNQGSGSVAGQANPFYGGFNGQRTEE